MFKLVNLVQKPLQKKPDTKQNPLGSGKIRHFFGVVSSTKNKKREKRRRKEGKEEEKRRKGREEKKERKGKERREEERGKGGRGGSDKGE